MNNIYVRLAKTNIQNNRQLYLPYIISGIVTVMMFYLMMFINNNPGLKSIPGSVNLITIMALVCTACANAAADTDVSYNQPNLKYGRYYLNGDVNSKLYIDLDENYIVMGNEEELRKFLEEYCSAIDDYSTEELYKENVEEAINGYGLKSEYNYMTINPGTIIHVIIFDYFKFGTFDENTVTGVYYEYVEEGKIKVLEKEFILV